MDQRVRPTGMFGFTIVWFGQLVSMLGTGMTRFALTIWAWQVTGSATALALVGFFSFGPLVLMSPIAGALVDRWNRKLVMMLSDLAAGLSSIAILLLYVTGNLEVWHLYVAGAFAGAFESFQFPAFSAAIATMLPKRQYARANGMLSLAESVSLVFAPLIAGLLLVVIGIGGILTIDIITFSIAIGALLLIHVPQPAPTEAGEAGRGSLWHESVYGFRYILARPSLLGLQLVFFGINLTGTLAFTLLAPLILARTGNNSVMLGTVESAAGIGGLVGGLVLSAWGGLERRVHGVLGGMLLSSLFGQVTMGIGQTLPVWIVGAFLNSFFIPFVNGSNQAIWQAKVAPDVQGRVFAVRRVIAQLTIPLATLLAGPLADVVFGPAMMPGGALAGRLGGLFGTGLGAGIGVIYAITGVFGAAIALVGYLTPAVRNAEDLLPDHDAVMAGPAFAGTAETGQPLSGGQESVRQPGDAG